MTKMTCQHEEAVLAGVLAGALPDDLRAHAGACAGCAAAMRMADMVHDDFLASTRRASVPSADVVWLRAQIRAREEAARLAARPILMTQAVAVAALLGLLVALAGRVSLGWLGPMFSDAPNQVLVVLAVAAVAWLVFTPVVLYLAFSRE